MRLNLGCGKQYLPGYINVDLYEKDVADICAPADSLDFARDGSVSEIVSFQLIEHLGLINAYKTIAHWAMKLEPKGKLVIETPDLDESLGALVKTKSTGDKDWLFGVCDPGQVHQHPFFIQELKDVLRLVGFQRIRASEPLGYWKKNSVRIEARMGNTIFPARVIERWCTMKIMSQGVFRNLPFEKLAKTPNIRSISEMVALSPEVAFSVVDVLIDDGASKISKNKSTDYSKWKKVLTELHEKDLPLLMYLKLLGSDRMVNDQEKVVRSISRNVGKTIVRFLRDGRVDEKWDLFELKRDDIQRDTESFSIFCDHNINELSMIQCALGIKAFSKGDYEKASRHFSMSVGFNSQNTISWWNLARVEWLEGNKEGAKKAYDNAFCLSKDKTVLEEASRKVPFKRPLEVSYASQV